MTQLGLRSVIGVTQGAFTLELDLQAGPGEVVALLGPNGAGKTTALRALAGLAPLSAGAIRLDGRVLDDPARGAYVATNAGRSPWCSRTTCSSRT